MSDVIGIGTDLVEIARVNQAYERESFRRKYYSAQERELIDRKSARAATAFAGKEAVAKALGTGFCGIMPSDIEILRESAGAPCVRLSGQAQKQAEMLGIRHIFLSLSDTAQYALAYAVAVGTRTAEGGKTDGDTGD